MISVIVPFYNRARFLGEALDSILAQSYTNWECIIVDDGSMDNSKEVAMSYTIKDKRFKYIYKPNGGASSARNAGLNEASGDWIQFLDSDDIIEPEKFIKQISAVSQKIDINNLVVYTNYKYGKQTNIYDELDGELNCTFETEDKFAELIIEWEESLIIPIHSFLFSSNLFLKNGIRFDESLINHVDFDVWLKIFSKEIEIIFINEVLCRYRMTDNSLTSDMRLMGEGFIAVLNKHLKNGNYTDKINILLKEKKLKVLQNYKRFDLMTVAEKFKSINILQEYYRIRIIDKIKFVSK